MLRWIRNFRLDLKTGVAIILLTLLVWAAVVYVNVRDFVPDELTEPRPEQRQAP
ncbi:MAG: hypothetical protein AMXMBFR53_39850 [Gemmatimonadota bacterium]